MQHIGNDEKYNGLTVNQGVAQPPVVNPLSHTPPPASYAYSPAKWSRAYSRVT